MYKLFLCVFAMAILANPVSVLGQNSDFSSKQSFIDSDRTQLPLGPIFLTSFSSVAVIIGAGIGWQAHLEYDDWQDLNNTQTTSQADFDAIQLQMDDLSDDIKAHSIAANIFMFGGLAGVTAGIIWWAVVKKSAKREKNPSDKISSRIIPQIAPGHLGLGISF